LLILYLIYVNMILRRLDNMNNKIDTLLVDLIDESDIIEDKEV